MSILITKNTMVLVQGMTGKEGRRTTQAMIEYRTHVVAGVTPGKGGQEVDGCPIFNSVREAKDRFPQINTTVICVPPMAAKGAILEAVENNIATINILVERIPIQDAAYCLAEAKEQNIRMVGPSSLGYISPGYGRVGVVGGPVLLASQIFQKGSIGIISRSGGMTNEVAWQIRKAGMGQSTAVHIGGDLLVGTTYVDVLRLFEYDEETNAVVIFGEHGGSYEFEIVTCIRNKEFTKPLAVYIGGKFAAQFPEGVNIGHAGAIVEKSKGAVEKEKALEGVGVMVAHAYEDLVELVKPYV